ncbi:MAG: UDP-N-acetylmuramoyl-tripeptide--D-alanyl-D-alanine ligase [Gammaproteobacteria bacterium]|nr:MAG: UDP-N-acetylmuramoyl-tripeptide--D-alanyl-D-alanine ligase [Gammaproteobacteria bacterium]
MSLSIAAEALNAPLIGSDAIFKGVSTDTRSLQADDLFVALRGPNFDGHHFLANAIDVGAAGALLDHKVDTILPYIQVPDTTRALGVLASFWRQQFEIPVIAITGSNGKTTVKEMLKSILSEQGQVCATEGNLNNHIGLPLTMLRLSRQDRFLILEMGMNHKGEIDYLSRLAHPTVALINNAARAHLVGVGDIRDVALVKGEIFNGLDGKAVINADDQFSDLWIEQVKPREYMTFALDHKADVTALYQNTKAGLLIQLHTPEGEIEMKVPFLGKHNVMNALAASTAAMMAGASLKDIKAGMKKLKQISGRLEIKKGINGACVLDDTYNANPDSLAAGIQVLKDHGGERVLVLGDMAELGKAGKDIHKQVGELARQVGISRVFALGALTKKTARSFGKQGKHFNSHQELVEALQDCMHGDMTILVKGSRLMHMEQVVNGITQQPGAAK